MKKSVKGRIWWWLLFVLVLAGIGYYLSLEMWPQPEEVSVTENVFPDKKAGLSEIQPEAAERVRKSIPSLTEKEPPEKPLAEEDYCAKIENNIGEFFRYLDQKKYVQELTLKTTTYTQFKSIMKRLASKPPIPAGEGRDPKILIRNVYYFFRILDRKDLRLIKEVIKNEHDTMENSMDMFYTWVMLGDSCPDPERLRPSVEVLYRYAGFFLNSTGGRAYLFRRSIGTRLLTTYYCILIVHEADKKGRNSYGVDILPFIVPLTKEITIYPDFQFQQEYIDKLNQLENYYLEKRQAS